MERLNYELGRYQKHGLRGLLPYCMGFHSFCKKQRNHGWTWDVDLRQEALWRTHLRSPDIDPIRYQLLFERFLNPERVSMPDIDVDFCFERRQEVIDYVVRKYGKDRVVQIVTFGTLAGARGDPGCGKSYGSSVCFCGFNCKDDSERTEYYTG